MKRRNLICLLAALTALATTGQAVAHPHVFSTMKTMILADDRGLVKAVGVEWTGEDAYGCGDGGPFAHDDALGPQAS